MTTVLEAKHIERRYQISSGIWSKPKFLQAVKGVSFSVEKGKTLAIVGESGCGKSTLARILTLIDAPSSGELYIEGNKIEIARKALSQEMRRKVQIVFQNPYTSLDPRQRIGDVLEEPLRNNTRKSASERRDEAMKMLLRVGLGPEHYSRYPHMFSGGQRQRIAIARALMLHPTLLVLDEPVSALDISVQAQVLNLLADLQDELKMTYVFISHDLSVVRHIANDVLVMYYGEAVEYGACEEVFSQPKHTYTKALLAATPTTDLNAIRERLASERAGASS